MPTDIKCPACGHKFMMEDAVSEEYKKALRDQMISFTRKKEEDFQRKSEELSRQSKQQQLDFDKKLGEEKLRLSQELEGKLRATITGVYENKLRMLEQLNRDNEEKITMARQKELEFLKKEQELKNKETELEIQLQKQLQQERISLTEQIRKQETDKTAVRESELQYKLTELEKQLADQRKLAEEMRRKADQGSMQLQGEVQELLLESVLREHFPYDLILEVGKGVEGADCMQVVRNYAGKECGKIIFESKNAKSWNHQWVEKLKTDMRNKQADLAILVTKVFPKEMQCFGEKDGVWICSFKEVTGMTAALRNAIIRISETQRLEENKGEKMQMLYNFLTGLEFKQQIEAIVEGFVAMKHSIIKERMQMEKLWKERERQLEKVLLNTSGMYGSIKGIAGASISTIAFLEEEEE
ncbi:MAG: DUF2130 domain-containing protein [Chitinophagaceae bacterium]